MIMAAIHIRQGFTTTTRTMTATTTRMMMTAILGPDDGDVDAAGPADASCIVWAFWYGIYYCYYCSNTTIYATSLPPHRHTSSQRATAHRHITQQRRQTTMSGNNTMRADPDDANYIVWAVGSVFFNSLHYHQLNVLVMTHL